MMYKGTILNKNNDPIPGATVTVYDSAGVVITHLPVDSFGIWNLDSDTDSGLLSPGNMIAFSAPGYTTYGISVSALTPVFNLNLSKKQPVALYVAGGLGLGLLLMGKNKKVAGIQLPKSETTKTILLIGGGVIAFTVVKKILETTGLWESASDKAVKQIAQDPTSFWNPNYWQQGPGNFTYALTEDQAHDFAIQVYDGMGIATDNEDEIKSVFRNMVTKANVSFVAWEFQKIFGRDLLSFLKSGKLGLPWNGLSGADIMEINNFVTALPNY